jgi:nucleotide-binding universal stress UspA family protein
MYQRILVAIDGSRTADLALTEAVGLAKTQDAAVRIAHVIDVTDTGVEDIVPHTQIRAARAKTGREILAEAAAFAKKAGLRVETRLLEIERVDQRIVDVLAEEAKAWPADLVVIGTHGRRELNRRQLGSVADELARIAPEPVLLVRDAAPE